MEATVQRKTLTMEDRKVLAEMWAAGERAAVIAVKLGVCPDTVYKELKRGYTGTLNELSRPAYDPHGDRQSISGGLETAAAGGGTRRSTMEQKQRPDETGKTERKPISVEEANSRAYQIGLQSDCIIKLEKRAGENRYQRHFKASSASALLNGMAVLIRDYAETLNLSVVEVLSVLAVVLTMPTIQEKNRESEDQ